MKKLRFNNQEYQAEKIIRNNTDIIGRDSNGNELFAFRGISDFTGFTVTKEDGTSTDFDTVLSDSERLSAIESAISALMGV